MSEKDVKRFFQHYTDRDCELFDCLERLELLRARAEGPPSAQMGERVDGGEISDRTAQLAVRIREAEQEASELQQKQTETRLFIESVLRRFLGPRTAHMKNVIRLRYLDGEKWETITDILFKRESNFSEKEDSFLRRVYHLHNRALYEFLTVLTEDEKNKIERGSAHEI